MQHLTTPDLIPYFDELNIVASKHQEKERWVTQKPDII